MNERVSGMKINEITLQQKSRRRRGLSQSAGHLTPDPPALSGVLLIQIQTRAPQALEHQTGWKNRPPPQQLCVFLCVCCIFTSKKTQTGKRGASCFSLSALFTSPFLQKASSMGERSVEPQFHHDSPILLLILRSFSTASS